MNSSGLIQLGNYIQDLNTLKGQYKLTVTCENGHLTVFDDEGPMKPVCRLGFDENDQYVAVMM